MSVQSVVVLATIGLLAACVSALPAPPQFHSGVAKQQSLPAPGIAPPSRRVAKDLETDSSIALGYAVPAVGYSYGYGYPYGLGYSYGYALGYPSYYWGYPYYYY